MVSLTEIVNEAMFQVLLYHTMFFSEYMHDAGDRYELGWSFIAFFILGYVAHLTLLVYSAVSRVRRTYLRKKIMKIKIESGQIELEAKQLEKMRRELSMIKEDDFESNHSEKDSDERRKADKMSDSDWDSRLGHTEKGYNLNAIKWTDLGRKYIIKRGKKSILADVDVSIIEGRYHTLDERYIDVSIKMQLDLNEKRLGQSLSTSKLQLRHSSVD